MGASLISLFPEVKNILDGIAMPIKAAGTLSEMSEQIVLGGNELLKSTVRAGMLENVQFLPNIKDNFGQKYSEVLSIYQDAVFAFLDLIQQQYSQLFNTFSKERRADISADAQE